MRDRVMTLVEAADKMRLKGKPHNQVRKLRKIFRDLAREGMRVPLVEVSKHETNIRESVVETVIRHLEGQRHGAQRIERVVPRARVGEGGIERRT